MKRFLLLLALLLGACGATASPLPPVLVTPAGQPRVIAKPTPRIPNRAYYTKRCWPACHYGRVHDSRAFLTAEFEGELGTGWEWLNEDPAGWSLTDAGTLRLVAQPAVLAEGLEGVPNVLRQPVPTGHFDAVVEVSFAPTAAGQQAVLLIQMEEGPVVYVSRGHCDEAPSCAGSGVYFQSTSPDCLPGGVPYDAPTASLMLRRAGNSYIGYLLQGDAWQEVGRCFARWTPAYSGITAISAGRDTASLPAVDFDSFTLVDR